MTLKRTRVVMLPTNEKAVINKGNIVLYRKSSSFHDDDIDKPVGSLLISKRTVPNSECYLAQHLYFLSDEEIKEGDWVICGQNFPYQIKSEDVTPLVSKYNKKITATTDSSLKALYEGDTTNPEKDFGKIRVSLPQPSQDFIRVYVEEYNKGNIIEYVDVEYVAMNTTIVNRTYNDFEPKVNSKNEICIKKAKDSWNREEMSLLLFEYRKAYDKFKRDFHFNPNEKEIDAWSLKWISENL